MTEDQRAPQESVVDGEELGSSFLLARVELGRTVQCDEPVTVLVPLRDPGRCRRAELLGLIDDDDVDEARSAEQFVGLVRR